MTLIVTATHWQFVEFVNLQFFVPTVYDGIGAELIAAGICFLHHIF